MEPLIQSFTKTLQPCSGCSKSELADSAYDSFWKPKETKDNAIRGEQTDSDRSGLSGTSIGENETE